MFFLMERKTLKDLFLLTLLGFFFFVFGNWVLSLTSPDEGRNAYAALHMLKSDDWIAPYYNCHPRFAKPPLLYWLMAVFFKIFGPSAFAARLVSGLSALGTSMVVYLLGRDLLGREKAFTAAVVFSLFIHVWIESRSATPEMLLVFFSTLGVYLFLKGRPVSGWVALGFAFLAKGPVGVVLPLGVVFLWKLVRTGNFKVTLKVFLKEALNPAGLVLFVLIGGSWYFLMLHKFGWEYFYAFFVKQNIDRFLGKLGAHRYPIWYYVPVVAVSAFLFLPLLPRVVKNFDRKLLPPLLWFLFVFIFYSLSKEKLHHYVLFTYPALALVFARYAGERYIKVALAVGSVLFLALLGAAYLYEKERFTPKAVRYLKAKNPRNLYFFKDENSALVFYLYRCIPEGDNPSSVPEWSFVITKRKYVAELIKDKRYRLILKGKEFGKGEEYLFLKK